MYVRHNIFYEYLSAKLNLKITAQTIGKSLFLKNVSIQICKHRFFSPALLLSRILRQQ